MSDLTDRIQEYLKEQNGHPEPEPTTEVPDVAGNIEAIALQLLQLAAELYGASKLFVKLAERMLVVSEAIGEIHGDPR